MKSMTKVRTSCYSGLISRMAPLIWRCVTSNDSIYRSQKAWVFHDCLYFEPLPSLLKYVIVLFWLHHHLSTRKTKVVKCFILTIISYTKRRKSNLSFSRTTIDDSFETKAIVFLWGNHVNFTGLIISWPSLWNICYGLSSFWQQATAWQRLKVLEFWEWPLLLWDCLYVLREHPRLHVLQAQCDFSVAWHLGFNKILELISSDFWWP